MKHKTWFRLVLKAIGVLMLCLAVPDLLGHVSQVSYFTSYDNPYGTGGQLPDLLLWNLPEYVAVTIQTLAGIYLLLGGKWLVDKIIPSNRPYCMNCGYPLSGGHGAQCPECGVTLPGGETPSGSDDAH